MERYAGRYTGRSSSQEEEVYKRSGIVSVDGIDDEYYLQGTQATRGIKGYGAPPLTAYGYQDLAMFAQHSRSNISESFFPRAHISIASSNRFAAFRSIIRNATFPTAGHMQAQ